MNNSPDGFPPLGDAVPLAFGLTQVELFGASEASKQAAAKVADYEAGAKVQVRVKVLTTTTATFKPFIEDGVMDDKDDIKVFPAASDGDADFDVSADVVRGEDLM